VAVDDVIHRQPKEFKIVFRIIQHIEKTATMGRPSLSFNVIHPG
jgi:hypothetical protein